MGNHFIIEILSFADRIDAPHIAMGNPLVAGLQVNGSQAATIEAIE